MTDTQIPTIRICKKLTLPFWNPPRLPEQENHGQGRAFGPSRYVVGWPDGTVKIGSTDLGRRRWGMSIARGGTMLDLAYYDGFDYPLIAEIWLQNMVAKRKYRKAFTERQEAEKYLGNGGSGYTECFKIPTSEWGELIDLAREENHGLVQR